MYMSMYVSSSTSYTVSKTLSSSELKSYISNDSYLGYSGGKSSVSLSQPSTSGISWVYSYTCTLSITWDKTDTSKYMLVDSVKTTISGSTGSSAFGIYSGSSTYYLSGYGPIDQSELEDE